MVAHAGEARLHGMEWLFTGAGVPQETVFRAKPQLLQLMIDCAMTAGAGIAAVHCDAQRVSAAGKVSRQCAPRRPGHSLRRCSGELGVLIGDVG